MLAALLHSVCENERQMLFEHLDLISSGALLLKDRGYLCQWLVALLNQRRIGFVRPSRRQRRISCVRDLLRSGLQKQSTTLFAPDKVDAREYECPAEA
ncbi:hypothetical protein [Janthinobacterium agaricidamnosum]|uniref:hypothetical protein n=1 Tax=Janthinobacterium agaricidamnosum TaxID=55508 RepID=UPI0006920701|nr:hypothetical protein [Janthinobacterium agaricidamnosum]